MTDIINTKSSKKEEIESTVGWHISWDEYFMGIAQVVRARSKDPNTKVGACIVKDNRILSTGYNGFPYGCNDKKYPWGKDNKDITKNKYFYVTHAELNAILNARQSVEDATLYVTLFPCNECAKAIIQSGIKHIYYMRIKAENEDKKRIIDATCKMFDDAGIVYEHYKSSGLMLEIEV